MISQTEVNAAQTAWAEAIIAMGRAPSWETAHALAVERVRSLYYLEFDRLLFCPTVAIERPFRRTLEGVVSYFVGRNPDYPEDEGLALRGCTQIRFENADIVCLSDSSLAMGHYYFRRADGSELQAEYSFVYVRDTDGAVKIQLHHSAMPYTPEAS